MKAIVLSAIGGPEVLTLKDLPVPSAGPNQVLVRIKAAAVNPIDYKLRKTGALGIKPGDILGFDAAGVVEAVGPGVSHLKRGDEVFYSPGFGLPGAYAEYNVADASIVALKPAKLSFIEAAALPLAGMTAYDGVVVRGNIRLGHNVLISAANGGVGSIAVQLAKAAGAYVFATCSTRNVDFVKSLGADRVLNYQTENWSDIVAKECPAPPGGLDLVYDCVGGDVVSRSIPLMKQSYDGGGQIVSIVNPAGQLAEGYRRNITVHFQFLHRRRETLQALATLVDRGQFRPLIDSTLPLEQAADAHRKLESGGVKGKIVLTM